MKMLQHKRGPTGFASTGAQSALLSRPLLTLLATRQGAGRATGTSVQIRSILPIKKVPDFDLRHFLWRARPDLNRRSPP